MGDSDWTWRDTFSEWLWDTLLDKFILEGIWGRIGPESKVARCAQLCASHWVQGSAMPPAAQATLL
jgi:hypothetical protein